MMINLQFLQVLINGIVGNFRVRLNPFHLENWLTSKLTFNDLTHSKERAIAASPSCPSRVGFNLPTTFDNRHTNPSTVWNLGRFIANKIFWTKQMNVGCGDVCRAKPPVESYIHLLKSMQQSRTERDAPVMGS